MAPSTAGYDAEDIELRIHLDIQDVFADLFEADDELEEIELETRNATATANAAVSERPLPSERTVSKRKLKAAVTSLLSDSLDSSTKRSRFNNASTTAPAAKNSHFAPFSQEQYVTRLSTFHLPTFSAEAFPAADAAAQGWSNRGRERLTCEECHAAWVISSLSGLPEESKAKLVAKVREQLVEAHKEGCGWRLQTYRGSTSSAAKAPTTDSFNSLLESLLPIIPSSLRISHSLPDELLRRLVPEGEISPALLLALHNWHPYLPSPPLTRQDPNSAVVQCPTCLRRTGLWTYLPSPSSSSPSSKTFDLASTHLSTCTYSAVATLEQLAPRPLEIPNRASIKSWIGNLLGPRVSEEEIRGMRGEVRQVSAAATMSAHGRTSSRP